jgi:hypothetical protein
MVSSPGFGSNAPHTSARKTDGHALFRLAFALPPYGNAVRHARVRLLTGSFFNRHEITRPQGENFKFSIFNFQSNEEMFNFQTFTHEKMIKNFKFQIKNPCPTDKLSLLVS